MRVALVTTLLALALSSCGGACGGSSSKAAPAPGAGGSGGVQPASDEPSRRLLESTPVKVFPGTEVTRAQRSTEGQDVHVFTLEGTTAASPEEVATHYEAALGALAPAPKRAEQPRGEGREIVVSVTHPDATAYARVWREGDRTRTSVFVRHRPR